jgi:hypothetical protein
MGHANLLGGHIEVTPILIGRLLRARQQDNYFDCNGIANILNPLMFTYG